MRADGRLSLPLQKAAFEKMEELQRENAELKQAQERRRSVLSQSNKFLGSYLENMKPLLGDLTTDDDSDDDLSATGQDFEESLLAASPEGRVATDPLQLNVAETKEIDQIVPGTPSISESNNEGLPGPPGPRVTAMQLESAVEGPGTASEARESPPAVVVTGTSKNAIPFGRPTVRV